MTNLITAAVTVFLIGTIDNVEDGIASVEITDSNYEVRYTDIPVELFPCRVVEGGMFYFANINDVTEIRCGEPDA